MKKFLSVLACTALLSPNVYGEDYMGEQTLKGKTLQDANFMGSSNLTDITATSLSVLGPLEFHNLTVEKGANIAGPVTKSEKGTFGSLSIVGILEATDITCKKLEAAGNVAVTGLTVNEDTNIVGSLILKASKDPKIAQNKLKNLNISAEETSLEGTTVEGAIVIKKLPPSWLGGVKKQVLRLLGNTTVKGNISFESGTGTIEKSPDAKIEGKVTGATLVEKK
jgi:hypothetical protein